MTDRPIIFSAPMVRALLDGRKSQTRRIIKVPGVMDGRYPILPPEEAIELHDGEFARGVFHYASTGALSGPYRLGYAVGDRLYVREHWKVPAAYDDLAPGQLSGGEAVKFLADGAIERLWSGDRTTLFGKHRQGRHMPRRASRLTLIVEAVKVERVQDISEADILAEGAPLCPHHVDGTQDGSNPHMCVINEGEPWATQSPRAWFHRLWSTLHTKPGERWEDNPFVVALTFRVERRNIDALSREIAA